jgi:hypothetical protein
VVDPNIWGADGNVLSIARSGNTLYVGGSFSLVGENSGGGVPFDARTGEPSKGYPKVTGSVYAIAPDGSGGWYVGGQFTALGGKPRSSLAQVRADGSVSDWDPCVTGSPGYMQRPGVTAIAVHGNRVYVGGGFKEIGGAPRENMGCVDARTGAVIDWNPGTHVDGFVWALAVHENTVFAGGWFDSVGGQQRERLAAVDATTGEVTPWRADVAGSVEALLVRADTLYAGGRFLGLGGKWRPMLAALDANTAAVLPFDAQASGITGDVADPEVAALAIVGDTLYVAGDFTQIGGQPRASLAALNIATGAALAWTAPALGPWYGGYPPPLCTALAVSSGTLYVGGWFEAVGGQSRPYVAALNRETGAATDWNPRPNLGVYALGVQGNTVYAGGMFGMVADWQYRHHLAALDAATGALKPWNPNPDGYVVTALALKGDRLFVSGDFATIGGQPRNWFAALDTMKGEATGWNPGANDLAHTLLLEGDTLYAGGYFTQVGGQSRNYVAAINATTGDVTSWNPDANYPVLALACRGDIVYVGGIFDGIGGQPRHGLAAVNAVTGVLAAWDPNPDIPLIESFLASGNTLYVGGSFNQIGGQPRGALAALDEVTGEATPWHPESKAWDSPPRVNDLALVGGTLYVGGDFAGMGGKPRICLAAVDTATGIATDWDPGADDIVWSLATYGNTLYAGGGFWQFGGLPILGLAAISIPMERPPAPVPFALAQSIPNPTRSSAVIRFALPIAAPVTLSVYDLQGRRVATPLDHVVQQAGSHDVPVQADLWKPGVYFYRLEAGGHSATRKMLVVK